MTKAIPWILMALMLVGCGDSDEGGLFGGFRSTARDSFQPLDQYQYDDFNLSEDVLYWETRVGPALAAGVPQVFRHQLLFFYAREELLASFEDRLDELLQEEPLTGFADNCYPSRCLVYVAGLTPENAFTILTDQELVNFFGEIDTEAELAYWLWSEGYIPRDYLIEDSGFEATVETTVLCPQRSRLRVFVDANGVITPVENLPQEGVETCDNGVDRQNDFLFADQRNRQRPGSSGTSGEGLIIQSGDLSLGGDGVFIQFGDPTPQTGGVIFQGGTVPVPSQDLLPGESSSSILDENIGNPLNVPNSDSDRETAPLL